MKVIYRKTGGYGATDGKTIFIDKSKNRSGIQHLDTYLHEVNHIHNPKMKERNIENKTYKDRISTIAII